jgi:minor extracellular serine protease Vpr
VSWVAAGGGVLTCDPTSRVFNLHTNAGVIRFLAGADFNGSTMKLPVLLSDLGLTASSPAFSYTVESFSQTDGSSDSFTGNATYNAFHPPFSNNGEDVVAPNATVIDPTTVDLTQWAATPQLGMLVFDQNDTSHSNRNEATEIQLIINTKNH